MAISNFSALRYKVMAQEMMEMILSIKVYTGQRGKTVSSDDHKSSHIRQMKMLGQLTKKKKEQ